MTPPANPLDVVERQERITFVRVALAVYALLILYASWYPFVAGTISVSPLLRT